MISEGEVKLAPGVVRIDTLNEGNTWE
jgi:hypothetical protein